MSGDDLPAIVRVRYSVCQERTLSYLVQTTGRKIWLPRDCEDITPQIAEVLRGFWSQWQTFALYVVHDGPECFTYCPTSVRTRPYMVLSEARILDMRASLSMENASILAHELGHYLTWARLPGGVRKKVSAPAWRPKLEALAFRASMDFLYPRWPRTEVDAHLEASTAAGPVYREAYDLAKTLPNYKKSFLDLFDGMI